MLVQEDALYLASKNLCLAPHSSCFSATLPNSILRRFEAFDSVPDSTPLILNPTKSASIRPSNKALSMGDLYFHNVHVGDAALAAAFAGLALGIWVVEKFPLQQTPEVHLNAQDPDQYAFKKHHRTTPETKTIIITRSEPEHSIVAAHSDLYIPWDQYNDTVGDSAQEHPSISIHIPGLNPFTFTPANIVFPHLNPRAALKTFVMESLAALETFIMDPIAPLKTLIEAKGKVLLALPLVFCAYLLMFAEHRQLRAALKEIDAMKARLKELDALMAVFKEFPVLKESTAALKETSALNTSNLSTLKESFAALKESSASGDSNLSTLKELFEAQKESSTANNRQLSALNKLFAALKECSTLNSSDLSALTESFAALKDSPALNDSALSSFDSHIQRESTSQAKLIEKFRDFSPPYPQFATNYAQKLAALAPNDYYGHQMAWVLATQSTLEHTLYLTDIREGTRGLLDVRDGIANEVE
jgi:hypothetical protein